jgi:GTPase SAR1 family protein
MASAKFAAQKVILVGDWGVGKSSLFRRFANDTFVASNDRKSTLGLDFYNKVFCTEDGHNPSQCECPQSSKVMVIKTHLSLMRKHLYLISLFLIRFNYLILEGWKDA